MAAAEADGDAAIDDAEAVDDYIDDVYGEDGDYDTWQSAVTDAESAYETAASSAWSGLQKNLAAHDAALESALADTYAKAMEELADDFPGNPWAARAAADARAEATKIADDQSAQSTYADSVHDARIAFDTALATAAATRTESQADALRTSLQTQSEAAVTKATNQAAADEGAAGDGVRPTAEPESAEPTEAAEDVTKKVVVSDDGKEIRLYMIDGTYLSYPIPMDWDEAEIRYGFKDPWPYGQLFTAAEIAAYRNRDFGERARGEWQKLMTSRMLTQAERAMSSWGKVSIVVRQFGFKEGDARAEERAKAYAKRFVDATPVFLKPATAPLPPTCVGHFFLRIEMLDGTVHTFSFHPSVWPEGDVLAPWTDYNTQKDNLVSANFAVAARVWYCDPADVNCRIGDIELVHRELEIPVAPGHAGFLLNNIRKWIKTQTEKPAMLAGWKNR